MSQIQVDNGHDHHGHMDNGGQSHVYLNSVGNLLNYNLLGGDLQYYKLEHLTEGLRINMGIRFAVLFIAFAGWLYIIYWLRHHEPLTQQYVGNKVVSVSTTDQDRSIMASIRNAFPIRTGSETGNIYAPTPALNTEPLNDNQSTNPVSYSTNKAYYQEVGPGQAISAPLGHTNFGFDQRFGEPTNFQSTQ